VSPSRLIWLLTTAFFASFIATSLMTTWASAPENPTTTTAGALEKSNEPVEC